jgi:hypothetical protein
MLQLSWVLAPGELCFARDTFGNLSLLDTRETPAPVLMLFLDDEERRVPVAVPVGESFSQFIDGLHDGRRRPETLGRRLAPERSVGAVRSFVVGTRDSLTRGRPRSRRRSVA